MNRDLVKQLDDAIAREGSGETITRIINGYNFQISERVNSFIKQTLITYTVIGWILLFVLFYAQSYILPHPGIVIELSIVMVMLPVVSFIIFLLSGVNKYNWESKKLFFDFIPTFSKKKKDFIKKDPEVQKYLRWISSTLPSKTSPYLMGEKPSVYIKYQESIRQARERKIKRSQEKVNDDKPRTRQRTVNHNYITVTQPKVASNKLEIPSAYKNEAALSNIRNIIADGRADNLKEAINIYEQEKAFSQRDKALRDQDRKIEELENTIDNMDRQQNRRIADLKRQRAASEHNIRKSIDDFRRYK